jgi:hypothetical protein
MALHLLSIRSIGFELGRVERPNTTKDLGFRVIFGNFEGEIFNGVAKKIFKKISPIANQDRY